MATATLGRAPSEIKPKARFKSAFENVTLGVLIAITLTLFVMQGYRVSGSCMEPHLFTGERVVAYKLAYVVHPPRRGDIVIFAYPLDPRQTFVKRIIGLPGDTVSIKSGQVFIDGKLLPEAYRMRPAHGDWGPQFVPHDQYFVMGDNRDVSDDSRYWGDLPSREIVGRAVACYWPPAQSHMLR